jgi:LAO/AO transport system kinase
VRDLETMLALGPDTAWTPPVLTTIATTGRGVDELAEAIRRHRAFLTETGERLIRRRRAAARQLAAAIRLEAEDTIDTIGLDDVVAQVASGTVDPWTASVRLLAGK